MENGQKNSDIFILETEELSVDSKQSKPTSSSRKCIKKRDPCHCSIKMKDIILALVTRALFAAHGLVGIWRAQSEWNDVAYWLLLVPVGVLVLEALFTVGIRGGEEISPCVLIYLCGVVPSIWFLELKNFETRQGYHYCNDQYWGKLTEPGCKREFSLYSEYEIDQFVMNNTWLQDACKSQLQYVSKKNNSSLFTTNFPTTIPLSKEATMDPGQDQGIGGEVVNSIENFENVNVFNDQTWVLVLHQLLLFILIIGRWLLPTGEGISRDELSQLLLVFIGVGADILEFVTETVKERAVRCDKVLVICIMAFWSWSTLQFTLVLTAAKARRTRAVGLYSGAEDTSRVPSPIVVVEEEVEKEGACRKFWTNVEVWGILSTLILQDGPFLAVRLYIMIGRRVIHQMIVFFTCKNFLVVVLQFYRLAIIATAKPEEEEEEDLPLNLKRMDAVNTLAMAKARFMQNSGKPSRSESPNNRGRKSPKVAPVNGTDLPGA
ncbi:unnamed protein product [Clavelina lepadiformis]|uniref:Transmembrane protein 26 n=1 Tax=Clavelina lepadiformis TaxID=159417 RepID=A0ABP0GG23_CLALP